MNPNRTHFADSRPLPPFGRILRALIEALQLNDEETYDAGVPPPETLRVLKIDGTTLRYCKGDLLKDATKREILEAFGHAVGSLGWLPFRNEGSITETDWLVEFAAHYEHTADRLANSPLDPQLLHKCLGRALVVDLGVRAGAMDVLEGRHRDRSIASNRTTWADDMTARSWIRGRHGKTGLTRDNLAKMIGSSESPLDKVLGKRPVIPQAGIIRRFAANIPATKGQSPLVEMRRHFAALSLQRALRAALSLNNNTFSELIRAFVAIRLAVHRHALAVALSVPDEATVFTRILENAGRHPADRGLWRNLQRTEFLSAWGDVFFAHLYGTLVEWIEQCHVPLSALAELAKNPTRLATMRISSAAIPGVESRIRDAGILELHGNLGGALGKLEEASALAPSLPGIWQDIGKLRTWMSDWLGAESALRTAIACDPRRAEIVGDLANLLTYMNRADDAEAVLLDNGVHPRTSPTMAWTWAMIDLRRDRPKECIERACDAADAGFKPGHCYALAAIAARRLGDAERAREFEKRARELGWVPDERVLFPPHRGRTGPPSSLRGIGRAKTMGERSPG